MCCCDDDGMGGDPICMLAIDRLSDRVVDPGELDKSMDEFGTEDGLSSSGDE